MKRFFSIIGCFTSAWTAMLLVMFAQVTDSPLWQFWLSILAALMFCIAILLAGVGNSKDDNDGRLD